MINIRVVAVVISRQAKINIVIKTVIRTDQKITKVPRAVTGKHINFTSIYLSPIT